MSGGWDRVGGLDRRLDRQGGGGYRKEETWHALPGVETGFWNFWDFYHLPAVRRRRHVSEGHGMDY